MPGVTRLLNRKKLGLSTPSATPPGAPPTDGNSALFKRPPEPPAPPTPEPNPVPVPASMQPAPPSPPRVPEEGIALSAGPEESAESLLQTFSQNSAAPASNGPTPGPTRAIKRATPRRGAVPTEALQLWKISDLKSGSDPLKHGLAALLESGAHAALFLAVQRPAAGASIPTFVATAALFAKGSEEVKLSLWSGMQWNPAVLADFWNPFLREGYVELSPPGTVTNAMSNRNLVRAAFGVSNDEWLTLLRAGPASGCRGTLVLLSRASLLGAVAQSLDQIGAAYVPKAA
jgi:hypothetical protein